MFNSKKIIGRMRADTRFYIDAANMDYLAHLNILNYEVTRIKIGSILRDYKDGLYTLDKTLPYKAITHPDDSNVQEAYTQYCNEARNQIGTEDRSLNGLHKLNADLQANPYDPLKGVVVIDQYNIILEGQHRSCIMLAEHGPDYSITAVRVKRIIRNPRTYVRLMNRKRKTQKAGR